MGALLQRLPARLVLENGAVFHGASIGIPGSTLGELVFNTACTGYQEVLTDPSYCGQIVMMTSPEIGNYGINLADDESGQVHVAGFVVRRLSPVASSWRAQQTLPDFLAQNRIVGIEGVDTRALTQAIRTAGAMKAGITTDPRPDFRIRVQAQPDLAQQDLVGRVSTSEPYTMTQPEPFSIETPLARMVVVDFGIKQSMLTCLKQFVREIIVLPASTPFETIAQYRPQGVLLSNGPGDPAILTEAIAMARALMDSGIPTFGICLGHQILALAAGARVRKMPFGHHGGNHPVMDLQSRNICITSQNHGYAADFEAFPTDILEITHLNLNDQSIEGFCHRTQPVSGVQFHPEASPGPHDARYLFARFIQQALALQLQ